MGGERERQRNEPSFSEEGIESIESGEPGAQVDLDHLLNEIGNSISATSSKPSIQSRDEGMETSDFIAKEEPIDEPSMTMRPEQPALDFGEDEQFHAGQRIEPLPDYTDDNMIGGEPMSQKVLMAGGAVVALSLLCGVAGLFVAYSASGKIEALQQSVDALQTKLATMQVSGDPRVGQLQAEQAGVTSRIDELALKIEGLSAGGAKGSASDLADLRKRLDILEHKATQTSKTTSTSASATTTTKAAATKPATSRGDWVVVLKSFATSAQAETEKTRLQKQGISSEVQKSLVDGKPWYRVRVPGYMSKDAAKAAIPGLEKKSGIDGAWTAHR